MIATELRREQDDAFVVRTDEPDLQAVLPGLAYPQEAGEEFVRRFPAGESTPAIYERFAVAAPALLAQAAGRVRSPWEDSLMVVHGLLAAERIDWPLGGSTALAIRGVDIVPRDIDFTVEDHDAAVRALGHLLVEPPLEAHGKWVADWFGRAWIGMRVEWAAGTRPDLDDHEWTSDIGPEAQRRAETIEWRGLAFRIPPLDLQLAVTRERGLRERVAAIEALGR